MGYVAIGRIKNIGPLVMGLLSKKEKGALKELLGLVEEGLRKEGEGEGIKELYVKYIS